MANYYAGHEYFLQYALDTGVVTETTGAISDSFGSWVDLGYVNPAGVVSSDGSKKGFAPGSRTALYSGKGMRTHSLAAELRLGGVSDLKTIYDLTSYIALRFGADSASGPFTHRLRQALLSTMQLNFQEGDGQEITAAANFEAIAREDFVTPTSYNSPDFGAVLFWQNVMAFSIKGNSLRDSLMGLTVNLDNQIERKGIRPDWGDDMPMTRTPYGLMFHHKQVTGTLNFHDQLAATYFTSANDSTDWSAGGNLIINCNDVSAGGSKTFITTLTGVRPVSRTQEGVDSGAQLRFGVEFVATDMTIALS